MQKLRVIILGAGPPFQGVQPAALTPVLGGTHVLDWLMDAFRSVCDPEFYFVGGYHFQDIANSFPDIHFAFNPNWENTGTAKSLLYAPLPNSGELCVVYSDVLMRSPVIKSLLAAQGDVVLGVDLNWLNRYASRDQKDIAIAEKVQLEHGKLPLISKEISINQAHGEFIGLLKLSQAAVKRVRELSVEFEEDITSWDLPMLVNHLLHYKLKANVVKIQGDWAELNAPEDLARFILGTKAESLARLEKLVKKSHIGQQMLFTTEDWQRNSTLVIQNIKNVFEQKSLVVRSSALSEDSWTQSNAGNFASVLNVPGNDSGELTEAIERVIASYLDDGPKNQVLIQAALQDVVRSGVVLTRSLGRGAPYYTINYEDSPNTDGVTSGLATAMRTIVLHRGHATNPAIPDGLESVLFAVREIESLLGYDTLDIEFAQTVEGRVHILQVRPIVVSERADQPSDQTIEATLKASTEFFQRRQIGEAGLLGKRAVYGIMPDWNPAEIVGTNPRPLALSLYQYLITDNVWARQRAEYGYRDLRPQPLLVSFAGHPYIDTRASFASFIPASVPDELASRLMDHYLERLRSDPELHDKVEFDIAFTCLYFDFTRQAEVRLKPAGFSEPEIQILKNGLHEVTLNGFKRYKIDLERIKALEGRFTALEQTKLSPIDRAYALLQDCVEMGTLPFAHLARGGFVAATLLRSLERLNVISAEQVSNFINSLSTVTRHFEIDGARVASGELAWEDFVKIYGHLRPGTYEITSPNYAQDPDLYLAHMLKSSSEPAPDPPDQIWPKDIKIAISSQLDQLGLPSDFFTFEDFLRKTIAGRESSKFAFSKNLSRALESIAELGAGYGLDREQLSFISISDILLLRSASPSGDIGGWLRARAKEGERLHSLTQATLLPPLITASEDFWGFEVPSSRPNFVSLRRIVAPIASLTSGSGANSNIKGKIVLIPQADPGYDWLFGREIAGLITAYGGANSHMTIRAAELNLPAAIGVGEAMLAKLSLAKIIELDSRAKKINIVQ